MNPQWLILSFLLLGFVPLVPKTWSEIPQKIYLKVTAETLGKFLAATPLMAAVEKPPKEVCPGMVLTLSPGEEEVIRLGNRAGCKVMWTDIDGTFEAFITYRSGKTERRVLSPNTPPFTYREFPSSMRVKAVTNTSLRFHGERPQEVQTAQPEAQTQGQPKPSLPSRPIAVGSNIMSTVVDLLMMAFWVIIGFSVIYAIIRFTKSSSTVVDSHWAKLIENLQASPKEFYASVEKAIEKRQVPAISNCRVDWKEGGLFTTMREYLRINRETHVLDICGAPYGTGFFVSWWLAELQPSAIGPTLAVIWLFLSVNTVSSFFFGSPQEYFVTATAVIMIFLLVGILINRSAGKNWVRYVLVIPVIGWLMKRLFMPPTYYRIDTESMFRLAIENAVQEVVDQMIQAKGLRALTELERKPILREFFQR